jgi:hypothetical protein
MRIRAPCALKKLCLSSRVFLIKNIYKVVNSHC